MGILRNCMQHKWIFLMISFLLYEVRHGRISLKAGCRVAGMGLCNYDSIISQGMIEIQGIRVNRGCDAVKDV